MTEKENDKKTTRNISEDSIKFDKVKKPTQLEQAKQEAAEYKDMALRKMAELENFRRNNQNAAAAARERAIGDVIYAFLPALDAFSRAEEYISDAKTKSGVEMIKEQLLNVLKKYGVTPIEAIGKEFNPAVHECIMQVDSPEMTGKVVYEIERGYMQNDKVLRFAKVAVGKEADASADGKQAE